MTTKKELKIKRLLDKAGYFIIIDFTPEAKEFLAYDKKIYHYNKGYLVKEETYNEIKHKYFERKGITIWDKTLGKEISTETSKVPVVQQILSVTEIGRRLR